MEELRRCGLQECRRGGVEWEESTNTKAGKVSVSGSCKDDDTISSLFPMSSKELADDEWMQFLQEEHSHVAQT